MAGSRNYLERIARKKAKKILDNAEKECKQVNKKSGQEIKEEIKKIAQSYNFEIDKTKNEREAKETHLLNHAADTALLKNLGQRRANAIDEIANIIKQNY